MTDKKYNGSDIFAGVEKLMEVYHNRPNFADADAQEDARNRLAHVSIVFSSVLHSMLSFWYYITLYIEV